MKLIRHILTGAQFEVVSINSKTIHMRCVNVGNSKHLRIGMKSRTSAAAIRAGLYSANFAL